MYSPGVWPFDADGGPGGGLPVAGRDGCLEIAVTLESADVLVDEHGTTIERPVAPQDLVNLGPAWPTTTWIQQLSDY